MYHKLKLTGDDIKTIREHEGLTQEAFGELVNRTRETVNKMETGKVKVSAKVILLLREHYGDELEDILVKKTKEKKVNYKSGVPVFELPLSAAFIYKLKSNDPPEPAFFMKGNQFADCSFGALAKGDYAMNLVSNGDFLLCREVDDHQFIDHSCMYFVVGKNGLEICRYIHPHPTDAKLLLLQSDQENVPPTPLPKQYITHLYKIRGVIRSF